jgi:rubrerythrin
MDGGIQAWQGLTAGGPPEGGVAYFSMGQSAADMAALAWALEENTRLFYMSLAGMRPETEEAMLFKALAQAEEHHEETLAAIHTYLSSDPVKRFFMVQDKPILEGGVDMETALNWAEGRAVGQMLELSIGLEANAYDRYLKMVDVSENEDAKEVFRAIAKEEKEHLNRLAALMDQQHQKEE